jgi:hypothetical protein
VSGSGGTNATGGASGGGSGCPSSLCSTPYATENCGPTCSAITSAQCLACEANNFCNDTPCSDVVGTALNGSAVGVPRAALCNEALSCLRTTGCSLVPNGSPSSAVVAACYCGSVGFPDCQPSNANGPCKAAFERGLETSDKTAMVTRLTNTTFGTSQAYVRIECDKVSCSSSGCIATP